ncbi:5-hydroxyisourate hydrolase, partial [Blastomyces silverae]
IHEQHSGQQRSIWSLHIRNVGEWYAEQGLESFWPDVEVRFLVKGSERWDGWRHYHVPVLLGPWNYATYRGS